MSKTFDELLKKCGVEIGHPSENGPTQLDRIEAQVLYTALMTDTLIEEEDADV